MGFWWKRQENRTKKKKEKISTQCQKHLAASVDCSRPYP